MDVDSIVARIDAKFAQLEAEEAAEQEKAKNKKVKDYTVTILVVGPKENEVVAAVANSKNISKSKAKEMLTQLPAKIKFAKELDAKKFMNEISELGCLAVFSENSD